MEQPAQRYRPGRGDLTGQWDAIVVGSGMGGLSAASFLAQQGSRVLVLEQNSIVGGCTQSYERRGYRFNIGLHYVGSVQGPTVTRRLFDAVTEGAVDWHALPSVFNRMVLGERSYDIPAGRDAYRSAMVEWFPEQAEAIDRYLDLVVSVNRTSRERRGYRFNIGLHYVGSVQGPTVTRR
ncbi:MAG: FAD-dependent oxidoreductase, partial [Actinomycetota bacterium]